jgi:hypothetical protein
VIKAIIKAMTNAKYLATAGVVIFVVLVASASLNAALRDANFKRNATALTNTIAVKDPATLCGPGRALAASNGYFARCMATGIDGTSQIFSVDVTFYPSLRDAAVESPRRLGEAWLVFEKPRRLTSITFRREGGVPFS